MKLVHLEDFNLPKEQFNPYFIEKHGVLLLEIESDYIVIGMIKENDQVLEILKVHYPNHIIIPHLIDELELSTFLSRHNTPEPQFTEILSDEPEALASAPHFIRLVNTVLSNALKLKASDIHIEGFHQYCAIRYRLDGVLEEIERFPSSQFKAIASRLKIMAGLNIMETRLPQDGRLTFQQIHMRISIIPLAAGESIVLRILEKDGRLLSLEGLGFETNILSQLSSLIERKHGLFIVTGPTGSGKTTTLTTLLASMNAKEQKIISLEDPIEYMLDGIDQVQINEEIGLTFQSLLRRCLRQDPDVILIGEMRDKESAELAIRAALTGHLVLSTLHTNDAIGAITRLKNMNIEPYLIADVLIGVLSQRLIRLLCQHCRRTKDITEREKNIFEKYKTIHQYEMPTHLYESSGCEICRYTGYSGRGVVSEMFILDKELSTIIQKSLSEDILAQRLMEKGFKPISTEALSYAISGKTSLKEVLGLVYQ